MTHLSLIQPVPEMVTKALTHFVKEGEVADEMTLMDLQDEFDLLHPFHFCKKYDLLVNNSGEEFAMQFMEYANLYRPCY